MGNDFRRSKLHSNPHRAVCERVLPENCGNIASLSARVGAAVAIRNFGLPWTVNNCVCAGRLRSKAVELPAKYFR
jgi:hypothetical protein